VLILTPEMTIANALELDVSWCPAGFGQQQLMNDDEVLSLIRNHYLFAPRPRLTNFAC
jgi:hypothetical protein